MQRNAPDREWEPAVRDGAHQNNEEYRRIMEELQSRELGPEDYELLLQLERTSLTIPSQKFLAKAFIDNYKPREALNNQTEIECCLCKTEIVDKSEAV